MHTIKSLCLWTILGSSSLGVLAEDKSTTLTGPYLGQTLPGITPKAFAPGIVSTEHRDFSGFFSPDMKEFHFTRKSNDTGKWSLISYKYENNRWIEAFTIPRVGRPILSPNGKIMHLGRQYMERTPSGWSDIKSLGSPFEEIRIMRLMSSSNGTYVLDESNGAKSLLRYSRLINGKHEDPKPFGKEINTGTWNAHPFIAPDESYLIWDGERANGQGDSDLYISFRQKDGSWGEAINMGDKINTPASEIGASVTPDGKFLFFNRNDGLNNGDIYWVSMQIIEGLR